MVRLLRFRKRCRFATIVFAGPAGRMRAAHGLSHLIAEERWNQGTLVAPTITPPCPLFLAQEEGERRGPRCSYIFATNGSWYCAAPRHYCCSRRDMYARTTAPLLSYGDRMIIIRKKYCTISPYGDIILSVGGR